MHPIASLVLNRHGCITCHWSITSKQLTVRLAINMCSASPEPLFADMPVQHLLHAYTSSRHIWLPGMYRSRLQSGRYEATCQAAMKPCLQLAFVHAITRLPLLMASAFLFLCSQQLCNKWHIPCTVLSLKLRANRKVYKHEPLKRANRLCNHITTRPLDNMVLLYKVL